MILPTSIDAECIESINSDTRLANASLSCWRCNSLLSCRWASSAAALWPMLIICWVSRSDTPRAASSARAATVSTSPSWRETESRTTCSSASRVASDNWPALAGMIAVIASRARSEAWAAASLTWSNAATRAGPVSADSREASESAPRIASASSASRRSAPPTPVSTAASSSASRSCCASMAPAPASSRVDASSDA